MRHCKGTETRIMAAIYIMTGWWYWAPPCFQGTPRRPSSTGFCSCCFVERPSYTRSLNMKWTAVISAFSRSPRDRRSGDCAKWQINTLSFAQNNKSTKWGGHWKRKKHKKRNEYWHPLWFDGADETLETLIDETLPLDIDRVLMICSETWLWCKDAAMYCFQIKLDIDAMRTY